MRKVADIKDPKIGMHIGFRVGPHSDRESEVFYGKVIDACEVDTGKWSYLLEDGSSFLPYAGDVLTYYGSTPKRTKSKRTAIALEQREQRYAERKAVRDEIAKVRAQRNALGAGLLVLIAVVIVLGVMAHGVIL